MVTGPEYSLATMSAISATEKDSVNWLNPELTPVGGVRTGQLDAGQRVEDVEHAPGLAAGTVDGERVAGDGLDTEAVEDGAEDAVVVEPGGQVGVEAGLFGLVAVHDALVEVGGPETPDAAGEHDVVAVVHLGQVVDCLLYTS